MRLVRYRNDPVETLSLTHVIVDAHGALRLHDARNSPKSSGIEQDWQTEAEATLGATTIFRSIGAIDAIEIVIGRTFRPSRGDRTRLSTRCALKQRVEKIFLRPDSLLRLGRQSRDSAVRLINDEP